MHVTYDVVIVGAGFSAIALTINLLRTLPPSACIAVVGDDPGFGRGTAYRTEFHLHRLNVPAARMSMFPDKPNDFVDWLRRNGKPVFAEDFACRADYGLYLRDTLAALLRNRQRADVDFIKAKAICCTRREGSELVFNLDSGTMLRASNVVLALGVGSAGLPAAAAELPLRSRERVIENPWRLGWLSRVRPDDEICILGSGLTMIDQVLSLREHGHRGRISVLSRRGLVPHGHLARRETPEPPVLPNSGDISGLLRAMRQQVKQGAPWRAVVDGLRPQTQALWQSLTREQRSRFLRHGFAWWNIHRHRIAPEVAARFGALVEDGTVSVHAGYIKGMTGEGDRCRIDYRPRGTDVSASLSADWVVNCTGMERAGIAHSPLLQAMRDGGMLATDPLGLGICVDQRSQVLGPDGGRQAGVYAVGALTAGQFWEITAVPDIRAQAQDLSVVIADEVAKALPRAAQRA
ncbi:FAD/NAD(P)-binding protein [Neorhizobium alkalisoli]|uniref:FAD/NAD(P)-binding protein n=1 Tax=Neorhizobium alkalisoli TaxID=528178 RepID=UPI001645E48F|nr:FAD/NAD(P)-binding protein [Neorhizobium alkalisoli]